MVALTGRESVAETGALLALVLGALVLAVAAVVVTVRILVPLSVRCCRGVTRGYRRVRPKSDVGRLMALSLAVFAAVGGLYLGVVSFAL